jgi:hypoxanthine phosphoribosyltransferase
MNKFNFIILLLFIVHYFITNVLEKVFVEQYITTSKRPDSKNKNNVSSLGMPSGHVETITIVCAFLVHNKIISINSSLVIIFIMALQRILLCRHTLLQTVFGFLSGLVYSYIYIKTDFSWVSLLILLTITLIIIALIENKVTEKMKKIPNWIDDDSLIEKIHKKTNISKIKKYGEIFDIVFKQDYVFYLDYDNLFKNVNAFIDETNLENIDCIVGIKTGGAILTQIFANKMKIPYFFIRVSNKKNGCKHKEDNIIKSIYLQEFENIDKNFEICEDIKENISNKNVLLIDEIISSGSTMKTCFEYLEKIKKVRSITKLVYQKHESAKYISEDKINLWSWGYDS